MMLPRPLPNPGLSRQVSERRWWVRWQPLPERGPLWEHTRLLPLQLQPWVQGETLRRRGSQPVRVDPLEHRPGRGSASSSSSQASFCWCWCSSSAARWSDGRRNPSPSPKDKHLGPSAAFLQRPYFDSKLNKNIYSDIPPQVPVRPISYTPSIPSDSRNNLDRNSFEGSAIPEHPEFNTFNPESMHGHRKAVAVCSVAPNLPPHRLQTLSLTAIPSSRNLARTSFW